MQLPRMAELPTTRTVTDAFYGYNHSLRVGDGEFYDMENLTSGNFPVLSPRKKRGFYVNVNTSSNKAHGLISKDNLCCVAGGTFYNNGYAVDGFTLQDNEKTLVSFGAYVIIFPDKKYINIKNTADKGSLDAHFGGTDRTLVNFSICTKEGEAIQAASSKENATEGSYYLDETTGELQKYTEGAWVTIPQAYVKLKCTGIDTNFSIGDRIEISGLEGNTANAFVNNLGGTKTIWARDTGYIVVSGKLNVASTTNSVTIKITRPVPDMDFVIESGNRLWGCKYGIVNGETVNEIYASKLGDFKNWGVFEGISTDSYRASVGTDGAFTGACAYLGYPLFFKEDFVHKVYGTMPSNFQIQATACRGVQKGSGKSLAIVNGLLYYKGNNGICVYDGAMPSELPNVFGDIKYSEAVGGSHENKYFISMRENKVNSDRHPLFVYDTVRNLWHKEDDTRVRCFCSCGQMYYIDEKGNIKTLYGNEETGNVSWFAETGIIGMEYPDRKYISRILVRLSVESNANVSFSMQYNSVGGWQTVKTIKATTLQSFGVSIIPKRCDHFRLRIEGEGNAKIYSITKTIEKGSDV